MLSHAAIWTAAVLLSCGVAANAADGKNEADIAKWRLEHDQHVRSEKGPLYTIGRHRLAEGSKEIGSDSECSVILPTRAPKRVGVISRRDDKVTFEPAPGVAVTVDGKPVTGVTVLRTGLARDVADTLKVGDFSLTARLVGGNYLLSVRDMQSHFLNEFQGAVWYPADPAYRVDARFTPYADQKTMQIPDTTGGVRKMPAPGYVTFRLRGEQLQLEPVLSGGELFFMFKDRTSGKETYEAGRFLSAEMPKDGKTILDFNRRIIHGAPITRMSRVRFHRSRIICQCALKRARSTLARTDSASSELKSH
jgi:uncharacterized protein (DUF1684 family)